MPTLVSRKVVKREFVKMRKQTRRGRFFEIGRCIITFSVSSEYDYVLIDCPPNLYILTQNALLASDYYVVTALPDHLSTIGISLLMQGVDKIVAGMKKYAGLIGEAVSTPALGGIVFVRVLRQMPTRMHSETMNQVSKRYPGNPLDEDPARYSRSAQLSLAAAPGL
jgi:cellulose biosynthesis protein BcsQ